MTPQQSQSYGDLLSRCSPAGISVSISLGPFAPGGQVAIIELMHAHWSYPMQRLLFPDGVIV